jgi:hypothetical protein
MGPNGTPGKGDRFHRPVWGTLTLPVVQDPNRSIVGGLIVCAFDRASFSFRLKGCALGIRTFWVRFSNPFVRPISVPDSIALGSALVLQVRRVATGRPGVAGADTRTW